MNSALIEGVAVSQTIAQYWRLEIVHRVVSVQTRVRELTAGRSHLQPQVHFILPGQSPTFQRSASEIREREMVIIMA
jgi:hypothetical protein